MNEIQSGRVKFDLPISFEMTADDPHEFHEFKKRLNSSFGIRYLFREHTDIVDRKYTATFFLPEFLG